MGLILDHPIKIISLNSCGEFKYKMFMDYCMPIVIDVEHLISHLIPIMAKQNLSWNASTFTQTNFIWDRVLEILTWCNILRFIYKFVYLFMFIGFPLLSHLH